MCDRIASPVPGCVAATRRRSRSAALPNGRVPPHHPAGIIPPFPSDLCHVWFNPNPSPIFVIDFHIFERLMSPIFFAQAHRFPGCKRAHVFTSNRPAKWTHAYEGSPGGWRGAAEGVLHQGFGETTTWISNATNRTNLIGLSVCFS